MTLLEKFHILDNKDIDIISRMQDYTSQSLHTGRFFDKFLGWYLLFYLKRTRIKGVSTKVTLPDLLKDYKDKLMVVPIDDNLSDYSRFQSSSNMPFDRSGYRGTKAYRGFHNFSLLIPLLLL
jgi:hypothetical protein